MGGGRYRASTGDRVAARTPPERIHTPIIPAPPHPSFLRRQEPAPFLVIPAQAGTHPTPSPHPPIHPSPLLGGRLGGGWEVSSVYRRSRGCPHPPRTHPHPHHSRAPPPVIPAQAGTRALPRHSCAGRNPPNPLPPSPNSSLPPFRGEARWGVGGIERLPAIAWLPVPSLGASTPPSSLRPNRHSCAGRNLRPSSSFLRRQEPAPLLVIPAQAGTRAPPRHSCAGRNPHPLAQTSRTLGLPLNV